MVTFSARRIALLGLRCDPALRFMANTTKGFRVVSGFGCRFIGFLEVIEVIDGRGARRWSRTIDARLFKPSLYRLSYPCKSWKQRLDSNQRFRAYETREDGQTPLLCKIGRCTKIRTSGPCVPNAVL